MRIMCNALYEQRMLCGGVCRVGVMWGKLFLRL